MNLEREYVRTVNAYNELLHKTLREHLPSLRVAIGSYAGRLRGDAVYYSYGGDSTGDIIDATFAVMQAIFESRAQAFGVERRILGLAHQARQISINSWRNLVRNTLGINIVQDYYMGEFFRSMMNQWVTNNVGLITSAPQSTLAELHNIITAGFQSNLSNHDLSRQIQKTYNAGIKKSQFWARDQIAKLNADMQQQQQADAGVQEYVWSTSGDERVREDHKHFDGKRFHWSKPPMNYYDTKSKGQVNTAPYHPGKAYRCRCVALPVFDIATLSLPWEGEAV